MTGVEIDFVVKNCLKAIELYEKIFDVKRIEVTNFPQGQNEAVFSIYGTRFHMLDENLEFQLIAPKPEDPNPIWFNVLVPDINEVHESAIELGCVQLQEVTEIEAFGVSNSMFTDPFGYVWMLHQVHKEVSFEKRVETFEEKFNNDHTS